VLAELYDSLAGTLTPQLRKVLVEYLKGRIESVSDPKKRQNATAKIAERLGDVDYWVDYASKL